MKRPARDITSLIRLLAVFKTPNIAWLSYKIWYTVCKQSNYMIVAKIFDPFNKPSELEKNEIVDFLFDNLEQYGDSKSDIKKAIEYSIKEFTSFGGFTMLLMDNDVIVGSTVINETGMGGYIPENILVYIATHKEYRGKGLGKTLMEKVIDHSKGDIALHVDANNPARHLYEKFGFSNPYLEMRLKK
ncbi:MAG: ribosomal-protein-alanine N-acetyltransferase [Paraglaciecola sp.]|jgi:ribosomal-protein-alanine N-acetyltransferase